MAIVENFTMLLRRDAADANITYTNVGGTFAPPFRFRVRFFRFDGVNPAQLLDTREIPLTQVTSPATPNTYSGASYIDGSTYPAEANMLQGVFLDAANKQFGFGETIFPAAEPTQNGYIPQRRNAQYLIRDFTKLNGIQKSAGGTYRVWDIDFISTQALSMAQAANKCRELVAAASADPNFSLQYRRRALPNEEWTAQRDATFNQAMGEIARVIDFAVEEVQNQQKFNLVNPQLLKVNP
jgi:hypothetical protein